METKKRSGRTYFAWIGGAILVFLLIAGVRVSQIMGAVAQFSKMRPPSQAVTTTVVKTETWPNLIKAIGSLEAVNGVVLSADLPGVVGQINFESGASAKNGDILVQISVEQEQALMKSAEAKRDLAAITLARQKELWAKQSAAKADYDTADANYRDMVATVANAQASMNRKTIKAPFDGVLGIRKVQLGQYVNSGDQIVSLQSLDPIRVNFSLPQQALATIHPGSTVEITSDATGTEVFTGVVNAVNSKVDEATRTIQAQATLGNTGLRLRPGMFVSVEIKLPDEQAVLPLPATAINYAPYGNSIFIVEEMKDKEGKPFKGVRQQFVTTGATRGDLVAVTKGLKAGEEVVTSGVFKLQNGGPVTVNNSVQPGSDPNPKPTDT
jgi:membrane fusion protein, multidrug efflux system